MSNFLTLDNVAIQLNNSRSVQNICADIQKGEIISILGPSGVGKTTLLRTISGLHPIWKGRIQMNQKTLSSHAIHAPIKERNMAFSFQNHCLFDHHTVQKNIELGFQAISKKNIPFSIDQLMELFQIQHLKNNFPHQISGGESQRVSLVRSLVTGCDLLLLDEPLSNVDLLFKEELQKQLKNILKAFQLTTIFVTHDIEEAFYMSDKCMVLLNQKMLQFSSPYNLYHLPENTQIINFLKRGALIDGVITNENTILTEDLGSIKGKFTQTQIPNKNVRLLIQLGDLEHSDNSSLQLKIVDKRFTGNAFIYTLQTDSGKHIKISVNSHHNDTHKINTYFGIKQPIHIEHLVVF